MSPLVRQAVIRYYVGNEDNLTQKTMATQELHAAQDLSAQSTAEKQIPKEVADRFGITGFRTTKFKNHDEDLSKVDRCSDSPAVMEAFEVFFNAK
jgi:hypothetical protein